MLNKSLARWHLMLGSWYKPNNQVHIIMKNFCKLVCLFTYELINVRLNKILYIIIFREKKPINFTKSVWILFQPHVDALKNSSAQAHVIPGTPSSALDIRANDMRSECFQRGWLLLSYLPSLTKCAWPPTRSENPVLYIYQRFFTKIVNVFIGRYSQFINDSLYKTRFPRVMLWI